MAATGGKLGKMIDRAEAGMRAAQRASAWTARIVLVAALGLFSFPVGAQEPKQQPSSPVGGPAWSAKVNPESQVAGVTLDPKQIELVKKVGGYFNDLQTLRGTFVQTASDNKRLRGKFFVKKPGQLRFEYNPPSKQLIVSNGQQLAIQDLDLGTDDRLALEQTVFRILLRKDVDLLRDARILDVQESDDLIVLSMQDKSPDTSGRIRLFMTKAPTLELKEWVTVDAQGETRVELTGVTKGEELDAALFKIESPTLKKQQ